MKKILSVFTVFFMFMGMGISAVCGNSGYVIADVVSLTNFLSGKSDTVNDKNYDINDDGVWDVFDLCLLRRQFLNSKPEKTNDILVAYFSCTNNTKGIAECVINYLNADSYAIEPKIPYTADDLNYNTDCRANREQNDDTARPEISGGIDNMNDYSTVFIGYPIWWGQAPKIMYTFLESYDLSGKTIIPFCTSGSSPIGTSAKNLSASAPNSTWLDGKRFSGSAKESEVTSWVDSMDLVKEQNVNDGFVEIKGGTFTMGSPENEPERSFDEIQHEVSVDSFYMSPMEITQAEYAEVMGDNPSETKGDKLPVTNISWYDAVRFCNALSKKAGLTEAYKITGTNVTWDKSANGYRLPTEAEWEYAARANTQTPFSFGDYVHNSDANCYNAYGYNNDASGDWINGADSYLRKTVEVTRYNANPFGLYNIHGNVAEWVWDWYGKYDETKTNPVGLESGNAKIIRGGGWNDHPKHIRSAYRGAHPANDSLYSIGIRPVRSAAASKGEIKSYPNISDEKSPEKALIVYFSQTGNTDGLAQMIHEISGADIFRLERAVPYSSSSNGPVLYGEALDELKAEAVPELKEYPDIDQYDTILLGYCNWWSSVPATVRTFLTHYDMSGKTIIPFCSMGGGRFGQTISAIAKLAPESNIKPGLDITYSSYDEERIEKWLADSGINNNKQTASEYFYITANGTTFKAKFAENSSANALIELLEKGDLTINAVDYGNFEKYGEIGTTLPQNNEQITTVPGDVILYQGDKITVYYDENSWNFTRLGKIENVTKEELLDAFGKGDVEITFSIK